MFCNNRKTIGVFLERAGSEFQNHLCQGVMTKATELGYNVAVFSGYGNYGQNDRYFVGDQYLWDLPQYEELSGAILALDTMDEMESRTNLTRRVEERCNCPVVSIRELLKGANNLLVDNKICMEGIIDHFVRDHGMKHICFMTGPKGHWDAEERLGCFFRKMKEYGLPQPVFSDERGSFIVRFGKEPEHKLMSDATAGTTKIADRDLISFCETPRSRDEICEFLNLKSKAYVVKEYVAPLIEEGLIEMSIPEKPRSSHQRYFTINPRR